LKFAEIVCKTNDRIQRVYFHTTAYISLIAPAGGSVTLEVGMVGNEGMFGITVLLDVKTSPLTGLVQGSGHALQVSAARSSRLANDVAPFRKIVNRYLYVLTAQIAQSAACNRFHSLDSRLARRLLMGPSRDGGRGLGTRTGRGRHRHSRLSQLRAEHDLLEPFHE
jgi:hypothetical protein